MTIHSLQPVYDVLNPALMIVATGLAAWLVKEGTGWLKAHAKWLGAGATAKLSDMLDEALAEGIIYAQQRLSEAERAHPTVQTNGFVASIAAQYVIDHPAGITNMLTGSTPEQLAQMALAKLPPVK